MEVELITKKEYDHLHGLLLGIDKKLSQIMNGICEGPGEWLDGKEVCEALHVTSRSLQNY